MSGEEKSSVDQRAAALQADLDEFENRHGLPPLGEPNVELLKYLDLTAAQLKGMDAEECGIGSVLLAQYSAYLQRVNNQERASIDWCEDNLQAIIRPRLPKVFGYSWEERRSNAIGESDQAKRFEQLMVAAKSRSARIGYLAGKVENTARRLAELAAIKNQGAKHVG
jgi:hypothetical protein